MSTCVRASAVLVAVLVACGPSPGDPGGSGDDDESTTREPASESEGSSPGSSEGGESSGQADASTSGVSTSGGETSSGADESSSTTEQVYSCDCASNELCYEIGTDSCSPGFGPETYCIETPAACEGIEPSCEGECGWEICGGPTCSGPQKSICDYITPGFVCGVGLFGERCNIFTQADCAGSKCVSFGYGEEYDQTLCADFDLPAVEVGEACVVEHGNGIDNCAPGSMCVADPPTATTGICRAACVGDPWNASCTDPTMQCVLDGWWFAWCLPM